MVGKKMRRLTLLRQQAHFFETNLHGLAGYAERFRKRRDFTAGAAGIILNTLVLRRISASEQARADGQARMEIVLEGLDACLDG
ncbi:MAG: hypothetical protein PHD32_04575, partial [Eubacteriales bacterium]|nr:hypothetical protein [Eubacteriales bacterium]